MRSSITRPLALAAFLACAYAPAAPLQAQSITPSSTPSTTQPTLQPTVAAPSLPQASAPVPSDVRVPFARAEVLALADKAAEFQLAAMSGHWVPPRAAPDTGDLRGWVRQRLA